MAAKFQLVVREPGLPERALAIAGATVVGRADGCDVRVADPEVGRRQFQLQVQDAGIVLTDLGATNRTRCDERQLAPGQATAWQPGAKVRAGRTEFALVRRDDDSALFAVMADDTLGIELEQAMFLRAPRLVLVTPARRAVPLHFVRCRVGRLSGLEVELPVQDGSVADLHADVTFSAAGFAVRALPAAGVTRCGGVPVGAGGAPLSRGSWLAFGSAEATFLVDDDARDGERDREAVRALIAAGVLDRAAADAAERAVADDGATTVPEALLLRGALSPRTFWEALQRCR